MELAMGHFNILRSFDRLKESGIPEVQARAIIEMVEESSTQNMEAVATKGDILQLEGCLKKDTTEVRGEINEMKVSILWLQRLFFSSIFLILINIAATFLHH